MMKFIITTFLISFCLNNSFCQSKKIDSLNKLIDNATSDTARINRINDKIPLLQEVNLDSAITLAKTNLAAAHKINYAKGEADGRVRLATNYCFKGIYDSAKENLEYAEKVYKASNDSAGFLLLYSAYGILYGMQSNYDRSITFFKRAVIFAEQLHNVKRLHSLYQNIATSYQMQSNNSQALIYYQKALTLAEQQNDISGQAYINLNLGLTYSAIEDTLKAGQALLKAISLAKKAEIKNVALYAYSNLATIYDNMGNYAKAYEYAMTATQLGKQTGDQGMEASALSRAALELAQMKKIQEAEIIAKKAVLIADSSQQPLNIYQTNSDVATILKMENKCAAAIPYFEKGFNAMKGTDLYDRQSSVSYLHLSECYEQTGDYEKSLAAYKKYAQITDSLRSKQNIRKATELTMNYEFNKKQQLVKAEQQKKDEVATTKQTALIIGLALMLVLAGVALYAFQNKRKSNYILNKQKTEIQTTLNELRATQAQLIHSEKMASLGELTAGIAHEIQNPLNFVNNFAEVNNELIEEMNIETDINEIKSIANNLKQNNEKIFFHGKRADAIVKGMLQHSRKNTGEKEPTDINALCDEYLRLSYHGLRAKDKSFNADFKTDFDASINKINIITQDVGRVLLNLVNNAFYAVTEKAKTADERYKPLVLIQTKKSNDKVEIIVKDNGNGIPQNIIDKIFQPFFTTKPTGEGTGLGLSLSYDVITKVHKGTIKVESKEGEGTSFIITLPVV